MATPTVMRARRDEERKAWPTRAEVPARSLAAVVVLISLIVMAGWVFNVPELTRFLPGGFAMKFQTAVAFLLLGVSQLVTERRWSRVALALVALIGTVVIFEYSSGLDLHVDIFFLRNGFGPDFGTPGRMRRLTALSLLLLALGGIAATYRRNLAAQLLPVLPLLVGLVVVYGYAYGVTTVHTRNPNLGLSVPTALCVILSAAALLVRVPRGFGQWVVYGADPGAALQRLLIPVALVVLPVGGLIPVQGAFRDFYDLTVGVALMVAFAVLVILAVGLAAGRVAVRIDAERERLLDELSHVNRDLEDRVRVRSVQLNRQRTKLALLEERDRIARDLHDRVIQRIFAAGLQVGALSRTAQKQAAADGATSAPLADSLGAVAGELDVAIRELRNSIFELTSIADHDDIEQVVRDIVTRASRILGFMPKVEVRGEFTDLTPDIVANLASVIQEALSNVARHARASQAEVSLVVTATEIHLRVIDDGIGMPDPLPRSSGVSNLLGRARALEGSATWTPRKPNGTVMEWKIPRTMLGAGERLRPAATYTNATPVAPSESFHSESAAPGS